VARESEVRRCCRCPADAQRLQAAAVPMCNQAGLMAAGWQPAPHPSRPAPSLLQQWQLSRVRQEAGTAAERLERKRGEVSSLREDLAGTRQLLAKQEALTRDRWAVAAGLGRGCDAQGAGGDATLGAT
jgi:hypothetical protein